MCCPAPHPMLLEEKEASRYVLPATNTVLVLFLGRGIGRNGREHTNNYNGTPGKGQATADGCCDAGE